MKIPATSVKKIGILRALQLGDMLCMIPAARALRQTYPEAEITLIGLPWAESFVKRFGKYFNGFLQFPGYAGLPEQPFDIENYGHFLDQVRDLSFDLLIQMQGNGTIVNEMMKDWGAKNLAGFKLPAMTESSPLFVDYPEGIHEIERHLLLMAHLGILSDDTHLEFPILPSDQDELARLEFPFNKGEYVVIHPGSRGSYRQWPPQYFASAALCCYRHGYQVVITGTSDERKVVQQVTDKLDIPYHDACGQTGLGAVAQIIKDAAFIICNCTGVSHVASATETPGIIISMDGEPWRWGPMNHQQHITINWLQNPDPDFVLTTLNSMIQRRRQNQLDER
jgi:ADP-heptose:LPS heptosyltransferase